MTVLCDYRALRVIISFLIRRMNAVAVFPNVVSSLTILWQTAFFKNHIRRYSATHFMFKIAGVIILSSHCSLTAYEASDCKKIETNFPKKIPRSYFRSIGNELNMQACTKLQLFHSTKMKGVKTSCRYRCTEDVKTHVYCTFDSCIWQRTRSNSRLWGYISECVER